MTLPARTESLGAVTRFLREGAREAYLPDARLNTLDLMAEEVFMNIARHSYPDGAAGVVSVAYTVRAAGELVVEFSDHGMPFDPLTVGPPELADELENRRAGGLGVFLLKELAASLSYRREQGWNRLTLGISAKP